MSSLFCENTDFTQFLQEGFFQLFQKQTAFGKIKLPEFKVIPCYLLTYLCMYKNLLVYSCNYVLYSLILKNFGKTKKKIPFAQDLKYFFYSMPADLITIFLSELPKNSKIAQITQITTEEQNRKGGICMRKFRLSCHRR